MRFEMCWIVESYIGIHVFSERLYKKTLSFVGLCKIFPPFIIYYVVFYFSKRRKRHASLPPNLQMVLGGVFQSSMIESNSFEKNSAPMGSYFYGCFMVFPKIEVNQNGW